MALIKQDLDKWLDQVNYRELNDPSYLPTAFALTFMNFIKLVNGDQGESHKTPPMHLKMLDKMASPSQYIANLCFRGSAKTTTFIEYMGFYLAMFRFLPHLGLVDSMIYISDSIDNGVKSARDNMKFRYDNSEYLQEWVPYAKFTEKYIHLTNRDGEHFGIKMFGARTGLRGTKIFGKRPPLAVLDDLVGDGEATSEVSMEAIKNTVYKGVNHALDPTRRKVILNGTPFNKQDILVEAIESGGWDVNVWPVCEKYPCTPEEFSGAWEDRFTYDYIKAQYDFAAQNNELDSFYQELMLRISSEDERLVQDSEIRWYSRVKLLQNKGIFNFYITTDFATTARQTSDYSVISVWAYNANGDWFWVDGIYIRQLMDKTIDDLFRLVQEYKPQQVGIEVTGQQGAFITWLQQEMTNRNIWFNFASSERSNTPGIRPITDKLSRFNLVVPWFKAGKFYFPEELKTSEIMGNFMQELRLATRNGLKGKDDGIDTISMLGFLKPWRPSDAMPITPHEEEIWHNDAPPEEESALASYIV